MQTQNKVGVCPCCHRRAYLTFHHLIPKKMHRRTFFRKNKKEEFDEGIMICRQCHNGIHKFYSEMELAKRLNSLAAILADELLAVHFAWVAKQKINVKGNSNIHS
ncbi:HNH endonuclease [Alteromonas ponticola]|uniref:HNH endonuclease n=1 Tax=Alteromonas ponticola TaxID=2720613 RepID=A0ABX1R2Y9_9ALTE|nr:HNH endonuclease [Alteromonas ponticola]NMH60810.1 HNH endonuclease [Alteromonas ponticola]